MCVISVLVLCAVFLDVTCFYYLTVVEISNIITLEYIYYIFALVNPIKVGEPVLSAGYFIMKIIEMLRRDCPCGFVVDCIQMTQQNDYEQYHFNLQRSYRLKVF